METKRKFLNHFYHPRFASGYDENQLIKTDVSEDNRHRVVPKLMITVPKWNKRINKRKIDESFYELLDTINRMKNEKAENSPSRKNTKPREA